MNFNCFDIGYEHGFAHAMNGNPKNYLGFPKGKAFITSFAYDSYVQGYNCGYRDGEKKRHEVYK